MDITEEQRHAIAVVDAFYDKHFSEDRIRTWCKSQGIPRAVYSEFYASEIGSYCLPAGAGGKAVSPLGRITVIEHLMRRAGATLPFLSDMLSTVLLSSMRDLSQREIVDELTTKTGHVLFSEAFTETGAGSDAFAVQTAVTVGSDGATLTGEKTFVSDGQFAPWTLVFAQDPVFGRDDSGYSLWLVPLDSPGISTFPLETVGQEMLCPAHIVFDHVVLDPEWRIQTEGKLYSMMKRQYELGRLVVCASSLGLAEAAMDDALTYVKSHMIKGQRMGALPQIQEKIADMETKIRAMRMFVYDAARIADDPSGQFQLDCALMKRYVPRASTEVASDALQIFGGKGYTSEERVGRIWKDCRGNQIAQGTDEVMARVIAKFLTAPESED